MIKITPIKHEKLWGYEIWLHCPLDGLNSFDENGLKTTEGPLLKIIKANMPLSVQVHPDDSLAKELENQPNGKSESWYILNADKNSEMIVGIKTFDKDKIKKSLNEKNFEKLLLKHSPTIGSFYNVPAGLVHGIGENITVFELQQPSDVTYRYYDYNRKDDNGNYRELHLEKAIKSQKDLSFKLKPISEKPLIYKNDIAIQEFYNKPITINQDSLVVDLDNYVCYKAKKNELINLHNFVVIHGW